MSLAEPCTSANSSDSMQPSPLRRLQRSRCVGRTAREILQTEKLERVLLPLARDRVYGGQGLRRPPRENTLAGTDREKREESMTV